MHNIYHSNYKNLIFGGNHEISDSKSMTLQTRCLVHCLWDQRRSSFQ